MQRVDRTVMRMEKDRGKNIMYLLKYTLEFCLQIVEDGKQGKKAFYKPRLRRGVVKSCIYIRPLRSLTLALPLTNDRENGNQKH